MAPSATWRSFVGVAKETTPGTAVVPSDYLKVASFTPQDVPTFLEDQSWQGSAVDTYGSTHGKRVANLSMGGNVHADTFGWLMKGILGDETLTGAGPYTHAFSILNSGDSQGATLTFTDQMGGIAARAWPGARLSEVKLTIDPDGNITWTASGMGAPSEAASSPTASFSSVGILEGWRITANVNGVAAQLANCEITWSRPVTAIKTTSGTQSPFALWHGRLGMSVTGRAIAENSTHLTNMLADTQGIFSITGTRGSGAGTETLTVTCTLASYRAVDIDRSNDWVEFPLTLKPLANATDAGTSGGKSPGKVTLINARSTVY